MRNTRLYSGALATLLTTALLLSPPVFSAEESSTDSATSEPNKRIPMEDVQRFSNAISQIKKYYVKPVDDKELFDNAIRGMLGGLDPHSTYLDEESYNELQTSTSGEFGGLGIEVTMEDGVVNGSRATMRAYCTRSLTTPISKLAQCSEMPRPSAASASERTSEPTCTWCPAAVRWRTMLKGRILPPRLGGNGKRWQR